MIESNSKAASVNVSENRSHTRYRDRMGGAKLGWVFTHLLLLIGVYVGVFQSAYAQSAITGELQAISNNPVQTSMAAVIEQICPSENIVDNDLQLRCNEVVETGRSGNAQQESESRAGMQAMAPEQNSVVRGTQIDVSVTQLSDIGARLVALREAAFGATAQPLTFNIDSDGIVNEHPMVSQGLGASGGGAGDLFRSGRFGLFLSANGATGDLEGTDRSTGFDFDGWGVTLGADYRVLDDLIFGLAGGYQNTDAKLNQDAGDLDADTYSISLYGTYYPTETVYIDGILGFGSSDIKQDRRINYSITSGTGTTQVDQTASADTDGDQFFAALSGGYDYAWNGFTVGPNVRVQYRKVDVDGYSEAMSDPTAAGSGLGMRVEDQDLESLTSVVGALATYAWSTNWGVLLPQFRAEWVHEFEDDPVVISARFLGGPTTPSFGTDNTFRLTGDEPDKDYVNIGAGISGNFAQGVSGYLAYQTPVGYSRLTSHNFSGGVRWEF